jgi:putative FmdB family regulatory protein
MPIYTYCCDRHGAIELLMPMSEWNRPWIDCPSCGQRAGRMAERVSMQPDSAWHFGQIIDGQEINSKSKIVRAEKAKGIGYLSGRRDIDGMKKVAADARKEKDEKRRQNLRKIFDKTFSGTGVLDSFGHLRPEAIKQDDPSQPALSVRAKIHDN